MPTLNFIGKSEIVSHHLTVPYHELDIDDKKSLNGKGMDDNLIIHGDSLVGLKSLLRHYAGKVDCVYLDFPYNTGKENWVYNDNLNSPTTKNWLNKVVDREDQTRHDKWLCMVYPRLSLVKELMTGDGIIMLSIDDNEVFNLKMVLDELFEEENYIGTLTIIRKLSGSQDEFGFARTHDYVLVYSKNKELAKENKKIVNFKVPKDMSQWKEDKIGPYQTDSLKMRGVNAPRTEKTEGLFYPIFLSKDNEPYVTDDDKPINKSDRKIIPITKTGDVVTWRWSKDKIRNNFDDIEIRIDEENDSVTVNRKIRPELGDFQPEKPRTLFYKKKDGYSTASGTNQLKTIFGEKVFEYPKPLALIKDLLSITTNKDSIILDATGGSGVTGHAVLDLNHEDEGNRKFILIECEDAYVNKVTAERVRKIIKGVPNTKFSEGRKGSFSYCKIGNPINVKSLLSKNNMPTWKSLAAQSFWMSTYQSISEPKENKNHYVGNHGGAYVYLYYKPDRKFMESEDAVLKASQIAEICKHAEQEAKKKSKGKAVDEIVIYAAAAYMSTQEMKDMKVTLARLPEVVEG